MADAVALPLALVPLASTLIIAVVRPPRAREAGAAVLGALIFVSVGAISLARAEAALRDLGGTVAFRRAERMSRSTPARTWPTRASLLLPVSNLTNLLAFRASGLTFTHFAPLMTLPTAGVMVVARVVLSRWRPGAADAPGGARGDREPAAAPLVATNGPGPVAPLPRFAVTVLALTLIGFAVSSGVFSSSSWVSG